MFQFSSTFLDKSKMQNQTYDEDLSRNEFFNSVQSYQNGELFQKAIDEGWIICVPKTSALSACPNLTGYNDTKTGENPKDEESFSQNILMRHILIPNDELPETHFSTLEGNEAIISGSTISLRIRNIGEFQHLIFFSLLESFLRCFYSF